MNRALRARATVAAAVTAALCVGCFAFGVSDALAGSAYTWTGASTSPDWSASSDWSGGAPSGSVASLTFPAPLTGGDCTSGSPTDACYTGFDDVTGLATTALTIDDGVGYYISGGQLTVGSGGIGANTSSSTIDPANIADGVTLGAPQTWSIDGGPSGQGELAISGDIGPSNEPLNVDLSDAGRLDLAGSDNEVGDVTIVGGDNSQTGLNAYNNGTLMLYPSALNVFDEHPIQVTDAAIIGQGSIGPVSSIGGLLSPGATAWGGLTVEGAVSLDATSALQFAIQSIPESQLTSTSTVDLGGAALNLTSGFADGSCPGVAVGNTFTLISATGISGVFGNVVSGNDLPFDCDWTSRPVAEIDVGSTAVTAKIVSAGTPPTTTTALSLSSPSASTNEPVTLTATVTVSLGTPAGYVDFESDGQPICDGQVGKVGSLYQATCDASLGVAGSPHTVLATFHSSPDVAVPSVSSPVALTVQPGATTTHLDGVLSSTPSFVSTYPLSEPVFPSPMMVAAEVTANEAGSLTPSGTVAFANDGSAISGCTAILVTSFWPSICATSVTPTGSGITAVYSGDANFAGSSVQIGLVQTLPPSAPTPPQSQVPTTSATFSGVRVNGHVVSGTVDCTNVLVASCFIRGSLSVTERLSAGKVVAVSASHKERIVMRTVTIGSTGAIEKTVPDGNSTIDVSLNAAGRALLAAHGRLVAKLTVTARTTTGLLTTIFAGDVTLVGHKKQR